MLNNFDKISSNIDSFLENCDSLLILGIGNDIRGDDGLGPYIINQLSILKDYILNNSNLNDINREINNNELENKDNEFEFFDNVNDINTGNTPLDKALDSYKNELNVDVNESLIARLDKTFFPPADTKEEISKS